MRLTMNENGARLSLQTDQGDAYGGATVDGYDGRSSHGSTYAAGCTHAAPGQGQLHSGWHVSRWLAG
eukprot:354688-Chlamydomonas_euryale.AAC.2